MKILELELRSGKSSIEIENGIFSKLGLKISEQFGQKRLFVVTDNNVFNLYYRELEGYIKSYCKSVECVVFQAGESSKNFCEAGNITSQLLQLGIRRGDIIIAFGGGVVGDLAGFVASILFRGVDLIQIPTTLLAQVDSSVGGKVGVDTPEGKNYIGSFYQPKKVYVDPNFLNSLDSRHISNGMAEVIKYGAIFDLTFLKRLATLDMDILPQFYFEIVCKCIQFKAKVVQKDEFDRGERMLLNFGHTVAHALEKHYNYQGILHGEAVSIGMIWAAKKSVELKMLTCKELIFLENTLERYNLSTYLPVSIDELTPIMNQDKKNLNFNITLILLEKLGCACRREFATL
ncbi:MAG: 3-dehydroquinate synthase [Fusobacteria bacterium]|nr:3-dehydroquinate synthase [Fusobacteriota bacterium]